MATEDLMDLREKQQTHIAQAREALEQITDDVTEARAKELEQQHDNHMAEAEAAEKRAERMHKLAKAEERIQGVHDSRAPDHPGGESKADADARAYRDVFKDYLARGRDGLTPEEDRELRAQATDGGAAGGFTVAREFFDELMEAMKAYGPMMDAGTVRQIQTATGATLEWPTLDDTSNKGSLLGENVQDSTSNLTFGQKTLDAYKYTSGIFQVSEELLQDSALDVEQIVREAMAERIGRIGNEHLTVGTGSDQPNGIVTASTLGATSQSATTLDADEILDLFHGVDPAYRAMGSAGWMFNDDTLKAIRKLKDGDGNYLWQAPDLRTGEPGQLLGVNYFVNQDMADIATGTKPIIYGAMERYVMRMVRQFAVRRLVERYADYHQVGFVGFARMDGELIDTSAVKHLVMA